MSKPCPHTIVVSCPHLEILEDFGEVFWTFDACECAHLCICFSFWYCIEVLTISHSRVAANNYQNLRTIQFMIFEMDGNPFNVCPILLCEDFSHVGDTVTKSMPNAVQTVTSDR